MIEELSVAEGDGPSRPRRNPLHEVTNGRAGGIAATARSWPTLAIAFVLVIAWVGAFFIAGGPTPQFAGVSAAALRAGRLYTPLSYIFVHAGPWHLWMNVSALLVVGEPVASRFGKHPCGRVMFFAFFLTCGALGGLGYVVFHPFGAIPAVGASGAICGLWGGASRVVGRERDLAPLRSKVVADQLIQLIKSNLFLVGLFLLLALWSGLPIGIAWEAHAVGFAAGLLLIGPSLRLSERPAAAHIERTAA